MSVSDFPKPMKETKKPTDALSRAPHDGKNGGQFFLSQPARLAAF
jgi:hypothetical protein